ncbi:hypothetical protein [Citreimonas sp.]|uniref:hypothetical protein n=1 Tax=Citreimonas sp. TaxID=3036715 RepID=UPI004057D27E
MTQRIENSDRGFTINKPLAWTMLTGVLGGGVAVLLAGIWIGGQVSQARGDIRILTERQTEDRVSIAANRDDIVILRSNNARVDQRLTGIEQSAQRTEATVAEILRYLRDGARP